MSKNPNNRESIMEYTMNQSNVLVKKEDCTEKSQNVEIGDVDKDILNEENKIKDDWNNEDEEKDESKVFQTR